MVSNAKSCAESRANTSASESEEKERGAGETESERSRSKEQGVGDAEKWQGVETANDLHQPIARELLGRLRRSRRGVAHLARSSALHINVSYL